VPELAEVRPQSEAQLHPVAAERLGLADGDLAELTSTSGRVHAVVRLSPDIRHDTVFLPFHYPDLESANLVTRSDTDPVSGMPEFKRTVVQMRRVPVNSVEVQDA
jgi:assimilatory nitrate reductase catalytic subunit